MNKNSLDIEKQIYFKENIRIFNQFPEKTFKEILKIFRKFPSYLTNTKLRVF